MNNWKWWFLAYATMYVVITMYIVQQLCWMINPGEPRCAVFTKAK